MIKKSYNFELGLDARHIYLEEALEMNLIGIENAYYYHPEMIWARVLQVILIITLIILLSIIIYNKHKGRHITKKMILSFFGCMILLIISLRLKILKLEFKDWYMTVC